MNRIRNSTNISFYSRLVVGLLCLAGPALYAPAAQAQASYEDAILLASDGGENDFFGLNVSVSGNVALIGAPGDEPNGFQSGSAYVFRYDPDTDTWNEEQKLVPSDGAADDLFGWAVAVHGRWALIGAYGHDANGTNAGAAYLYKYEPANDRWAFKHKFMPADGEELDWFGYSVALSDGVALVGAPLDNVNGISNLGSATVFRYNESMYLWEEEQTLYHTTGHSNDSFGTSVAIDGDWAVCGVPDDDYYGSSSGIACVFKYLEYGDMWIWTDLLEASDPAAWDEFGDKVAISGKFILVGAYLDDDLGDRSGSVHVFDYDEYDDEWFHLDKILAPDGATDDRFGCSVAVSGNLAVIGAFNDDDNGSNSGSAYLYRLTGYPWQEWNFDTKILASDGYRTDYFGRSVSVSNETVISGANNHDTLGTDSGAAYVYFAASPVPDVQVNGDDGPLWLTTSDDITVTISLDPGAFDGEQADWWVHATKHTKVWWAEYRKGQKPKWTKSVTPIRFAGAGLRTVSDYTVLGPRTLPSGTWLFSFSVDDNKDNVCDQSFVDFVEVHVN